MAGMTNSACRYHHMGVIDELYENRDETEISFALDEKFERLREFKHIPEVQAPNTCSPSCDLTSYLASG